jgi:hypothetical protein
MTEKAKNRSRAARPREARPGPREGGDLAFGRRNAIALGSALLAILLGYLLLSRGSITAAPLLLVLGYCVLVPYGLAAGSGARKASGGE